MIKLSHILLGLAMLTAALLPTNLLVSQRFHHDEALYGTWALQISSGHDVWLSATPIDKPPLFIYLLAGVFALFGPTESVARLPSLMLTALSVGVVYQLGRRWYNPATALLAAWLMALSPFTLMFAPTALTDPLLVSLILLACWSSHHRLWLIGGLCFGLAFATKQQAIFFLPLLIGLIGLDAPPSKRHAFTQLAVGFLIIIAMLMLWELGRPNLPDFMSHSADNYGGLRLDMASSSSRWVGFIALLRYATASVWLNSLFLIGLPLLLLTRRNHHDWLLALFCLLFLLTHSLLTFQIWGRYLLGLMPWLALLMARIMLSPLDVIEKSRLIPPQMRPIYPMLISGILIMCLHQPVQDAIHGRYPLATHTEGIQGIEQMVAYLRGHYGAQTTLYHQWLGTHWRFYLWGYPYDLHYWDTPADLARQAQPGQLIAFPTWRSETEARLALAEVELTLVEINRVYSERGIPSLILYRLEKQ